MTYNPTEPTILDKIRRLVGDASNDPTVEYYPDSTYTKVIGEHTNWKRACAEMALSVARKVEDDPDSIASDGDSMSWRARTKSLYALHDQMLAESDAEDAVATVPTAPAYMPELTPVEWR